MLRIHTLLPPACLALCACAATPSDHSPALAAGLDLRELRITASEPAAEVAAAEPAAGVETARTATPQQAWSDVNDTFDDMSDRHVTLLFGERWLSDSAWDPVDDQLAGGLEMDASDPDTGHGYEVGFTYSQDSDDRGGTDFDGDVYDVYVGYRYTFWPDDWDDADHHDANDPDHAHDPNDPNDVHHDDYYGFHPFVGGGVALVHADADTDGPGPDFSDNSFSGGVYVRAGIAYDLEGGTRLGLDYRHMFLTNTNMGPIDDSDFDQLMLTLGFRF